MYEWTEPTGQECKDCYIAYVREVSRRFTAALTKWSDDNIDHDFGNGAMTPRELIIHCFQVLSFVYKSYGFQLVAPASDEMTLAEYQDHFDDLIADLLTHVATDDLKLIQNMAIRPICDIGHHAGQLSLLRRFVDGYKS